MNKKITIVFVVAFLLVSCSPGFPIGAGDLNAVTLDGTSSPTQSPILAPTTVPVTETTVITPTEIATVEPPGVAFELPAAFQPFAAQWPLVLINQTGGHILRCVLDTGDLNYAEIALPGGQIMKSWTACYFSTPQGVVDYVNIPIFTEDHQAEKMFGTFSVKPSRLPGSGYLLPAAKKSIEEGWLPIATGNKDPDIYVVAVSFDPDASDQMTPNQEFYLPLLRAIDTSSFAEFALTGNTKNLPAVEGIDHFLIADALIFDIPN